MPNPECFKNMDMDKVKEYAKEGVPKQDMLELWNIPEKYWVYADTFEPFVEAYTSGFAEYRIKLRQNVNKKIEDGEASGTTISLLAKNILGMQDKPDADIPDKEIVVEGSGKIAKAISKRAKSAKDSS